MKRKLSLILVCCLMSLTACMAHPEDPGDMMPPDGPVSEPAQVFEEAYVPDGGQAVQSLPGGFGWNGFEIESWDGVNPVQVLNGNVPLFGEDQDPSPIEIYSELDDLGRCGEAYAVVCREIRPTEARGEIGSVKPSGWHTVRYNDLISGNYLYNRCHLIGYQLAGENANERNLITGTRYLNIEGMLPYENLIDGHLEDYDHHVFYRVTPVYKDDDLVAQGVAMEGRCYECDEVEFFVFAYNAQLGIEIDYSTGDSRRSDGRDQNQVEIEDEIGVAQDFVLNVKSGKFHKPECSSVDKMSPDNRLDMHEPLSKMLQAGYEPCGSCKPDQE